MAARAAATVALSHVLADATPVVGDGHLDDGRMGHARTLEVTETGSSVVVAVGAVRTGGVTPRDIAQVGAREIGA